MQALVAWANEEDPTWLEQYGDIKEVTEFAEVVEIWTASRNKKRPDKGPPGLSEMRYYQSSEHTALKRYRYDELFPKISLNGLGQQLVDNWLLRNRRMIDFMEQDVERLGSKRVLILVGEGHRPFLVEELNKRGYNVRPSIEFIP